MNKGVLTILLLLLFGVPGFSQHGSIAYRKLADSLYRHHHYQYAADYYEKALRKTKEPGNIMLQIAKSYLKTNKEEEAEAWFIKAKANKANFSDEDYYLYANLLIQLKKRNKADSLLEEILRADPNAQRVRMALDDLRNFHKYYEDSASYRIRSLSINTSVSEFAPVYYQNGIVFASARMEGPLRKKYHWDNSHFLNLYYSVKTGEQNFEIPQVFEKDLNTRHHEGPAMFYSNYQKMIINRNQTFKLEGREDVFEWHPGLYDAQFDEGKSTWKVVSLPFNDSAYTFAHPMISEDGNTLYFSSDKPGGYGGTDIYRVTRSNGEWGQPFNLGPTINTEESEAFPFLMDSTLYFASNGLGGLGGLDIFMSAQVVNGFTPPVNMGYPINSTADDFSLVTDPTQRNGYYASSREGNDDLFSFKKLETKIDILAHIYDDETKLPLSGAHIEIITNNGNDSTLNADDQGNFKLELPKETAYVIVGTKGDKLGMTSDIADQSKSHRIPAYRDTSRLACIGIIQNEKGEPRTASIISVVDETTGEKLDHPGNKQLVTFKGEKGHNYMIDIQNEQGTKAQHHLVIGLQDSLTKTWTMILPDAPDMLMAARVFRADDNQPLANADVRIITFSDKDVELKADDKGMVDFTLKLGTAYVVIGSKDDLIGMHSGTAEQGTDKASIIHPVPAYGDHANDVIALGLVTNTKGELIDGYKATVTNKATGENISIQAKKGVLTFIGDRQQAYNITVEHENYQTARQEVSIPKEGPDTEKFAVVLQDKPGQLILPAGVSAQSNKIVQNVKAGNEEIILLDTDKGTSKMYIKSGESINEITEKDKTLYRETPKGSEYLGKGELSKLRTNPSSVLKGLKRSDLTALRNIYFEFDKADLDDSDLAYLKHLKEILEHDPSYKLLIAGHADDRGSDNYNIKLSRRRAQAVSKFLIDEGIRKDRIIIKAYGESLPVVPCDHADCSEDDHQKNRRAEFVLSHEGSSEKLFSKPGDNIPDVKQ